MRGELPCETNMAQVVSLSMALHPDILTKPYPAWPLKSDRIVHQHIFFCFVAQNTNTNNKSRFAYVHLGKVAKY